VCPTTCTTLVTATGALTVGQCQITITSTSVGQTTVQACANPVLFTRRLVRAVASESWGNGRGSRGGLLKLERAPAERTFHVVVTAYVLCSIADCLTTAFALVGGAREANPFAARLYAEYGIGGLFVFKAAIVGLILIGLRHLPRRAAVWAAALFTGVTAIAVLLNL